MLTKEQIEKRLKAAKLIQAANEAGWTMDPVVQATEEEITGALRSYAAGVHRSEVQGILDAVLPEEGNTGFLLTDDAIYSDCFSSDGAAAMLPLTGIQSVEPVPGSWSEVLVHYRDGSCMVNCVIDGTDAYQDGLLALLDAATHTEKEPAPEQLQRRAVFYSHEFDGKYCLIDSDEDSDEMYWINAAVLGGEITPENAPDDETELLFAGDILVGVMNETMPPDLPGTAPRPKPMPRQTYTPAPAPAPTPAPVPRPWWVVRIKSENLQRRMERLIGVVNEKGWDMKPVSAVKEKALNTAIRTFAQGASREEVFAFYDTSFFGSGKNGFLLTNFAIYNRDFFGQQEKPDIGMRVSLNGVRSAIKVRNGGYQISYVDGSSVEIYASEPYYEGLGALLDAVTDVPMEAEDLYEDAISGDADAQYRLGSYYLTGDHKNMPLCHKWLGEAAEKGHSDATLALIRQYSDRKDYDVDGQIVHWYKLAAQQGNPEAQYRLGRFYALGTGVSWDTTQANIWLKKAEEQGYPNAKEFRIAALDYYMGLVSLAGQHDTSAFQYFTESAKYGHAAAQYELGKLYAEGGGTHMDKKQAAHWYEQAAEQGHAEAMLQMGVCCYEGEGRRQSYEDAISWWKKAGERGATDGWFNIGVCYWNGDGVFTDRDKAMRWWRRAAENGNRMAETELNTAELQIKLARGEI